MEETELLFARDGTHRAQQAGVPDVHAVECADGQHRPPRKREVFVCDDLQRNLPSKSVLLRIGGTHTFRKQVFIPRSRLIFWYVLRVSAFREVGAA